MIVRRPTRIIAAALRIDGAIFALAPPARHHDVMRHFRLLPSPDEQGFLTDLGTYATRHAALEIARKARQMIRLATAPSHGLFSEDVW
jgi:hypothetical protein